MKVFIRFTKCLMFGCAVTAAGFAAAPHIKNWYVAVQERHRLDELEANRLIAQAIAAEPELTPLEEAYAQGRRDAIAEMQETKSSPCYARVGGDDC